MRNSYAVVGDKAVIYLANGLETTVDASSLEKLLTLDVRWFPHFDYNRYYVYASVPGRTVKMHRFLTGPPEGLVVDHLNGDSLDNTLLNLRICSQAENGMNRSGLNTNNSSGVRGVSFHKASGKWRATVRVNRRQKHLGLFEKMEDAEIAAVDYRRSLQTGSDGE